MDIQEVKAYMKSKKITYKDLSEMTGLSISCITKIFAGYAKYPRVDTWNIILPALGLDEQQKSPPSELTEGENEILSIIGQLTDEEIKEARTILNYILNKRE